MRGSGQAQVVCQLALRRARPGSGSPSAVLETYLEPAADLLAVIQSTPFVVGGGVATRLYMAERMTLDVDILVSIPDVGRLHEELRNAGCRYEGPLH